MNNPDDGRNPEWKYTLSMGAFLFLLSILVFLNVFKNDFVGYDDQNLVLNNPAIRSLSPAGIAQMFVPKHRGNYQPIRALSYAIDYAFWGLRPSGYQLTNIILHAITVIGIWRLLRRLVPETPALVAAMIFAVHPLHVESVTWISARKDVLSLAFFLGAILLYERSEEEKSVIFYLSSIVSGALALLSKLTAVGLPLCILLLEMCRDGWPGTAEWRRKLTRLLPHILLVCLVVGLNFVRSGAPSSHGDALAGLDHIDRTVTRDIWLSMPLVVCRYLGLLAFPVNLSTHYDITRVSELGDVLAIFPIMFLAAIIIIGCICFVTGKRAVAFCVGWFLITFLPASNIVPTAAMMTDRYMHMPSIGFAAFLAIAMSYPLKRLPGEEKQLKRMLILFPIVIVLLLLSVLTVRRNTDWRDTKTLFQRTLLVSPRSVDAHLAIGAMYDLEGDHESAIRMYRDGLKVVPDHYRLLYNLGVSYMKKGWLRQGTEALEKSRAANPGFAPAHFQLALCYHQQKRYEEAVAEHRETLRLNPGLAVSHGDLGRLYAQMGKPDLALAELNRALKLQPDLVPALIDRAALFRRQGRHEEAEQDVRRLESMGVDIGKLRRQRDRFP